MEETLKSLHKLACAHRLPVRGRMQNFKKNPMGAFREKQAKPKINCFFVQNYPKIRPKPMEEMF